VKSSKSIEGTCGIYFLGVIGSIAIIGLVSWWFKANVFTP